MYEADTTSQTESQVIPFVEELLSSLESGGHSWHYSANKVKRFDAGAQSCGGCFFPSGMGFHSESGTEPGSCRHKTCNPDPGAISLANF